MPAIYDLVNATVHYGASSYPLNGLGEQFQTLTGVDDLDTDALKREVDRLTSFPRDFTARLCEPIVLEGKQYAPERIVAMANGYTITWNRRS